MLGLMLALGLPSSAHAGTYPVFGPEDFVRAAGKPVALIRTFPAAIPGTGYTLHIDNGGADGDFGRISSAEVKLNGAAVASPRDFGQNVATIDKPVSLAASNTLSIDLRSAPGSGLTLTLLGIDNAAPTIAITAPSQPVITGNPTPTVSVTYSDARSGVDTATLKIAIDGTALAGCTVGAASATCTPPPLLAGNHTVTAEIKDRAGNLGTASFGFQLVLNTDTTPPALEILSPTEGSFSSQAHLSVRALYSDAESGIDPGSVRVRVDGLDRTGQAQVSDSVLLLDLTAPLADGTHQVEVVVRNQRANETRQTVSFTLDPTAPTLAVLEPAQPVLLDVTSPQIRVAYSDATSGIAPNTLRILLDGTDLTPTCTLAGGTATCPTSSLPAGDHTVTAEAFDRAENHATAAFGFAIVVDAEPPALAIVSPDSPLITGSASPAIRVEYSDAGRGIDPSSLHIQLDGRDLTSTCQVGPSSATCQAPALARGPHTVAAQVADVRGNAAAAHFDFVLTFPLAIAFTQPAPDFLTGVASVRVAGTVSPTATSVRVNGVAATLGSGTFSLDVLGLHDGVNELVAVAEDGAGNVGTASVRVIADTTPPAVGITFPVDGALVSTPTVAVTGLVNDLTIGTVSDTEVTVTVNGVAASVLNRSFAAAGVTLQPGSNTLTAEATDRAGNRTRTQVHVTYQPRTGAPALQAVSGDGQSATIATALPAPLVVAVSDAAGQPMADAQVVFRVVRGDGTLEGGERARIVRTDSQGRAAVHWTLGSRAGVGVDRVRATAVGIAGEAGFSATSLTGSPAQIDVTSGDDQRGDLGTELSRPLFVVVTDAGHNPVPGVPVSFRVVGGGGGLVEGGGGDTAVAETDASGLTSVRLVLGPSQGLDNNLVEASFLGLTTLPATFKASAFLAGDPAQTRISGLVLDNQGAPVPGVTMRLRDATVMTTTDAEGQFVLAGVPVGQVFLIADATTATRPGSWASLEYELFAISGVENTLPRPIYILPLDLPNGVLVDETHGGKVTLPEVPGFAVEIAPGSVTFPGGSRSGVVSVTAVHADRVPMPPGAGMQPRLIVTIQPVGAHFDPPAKFTLPNVDGLAPGKVTELFSFDHDIGEFVAIGTGTVSEDGLVLRSDPGFGIVEAGWHCGTQPNGKASSATLKVTITTKQPIVMIEGSTPAHKKTITAEGTPPLDADYSWKIDNGSIASLNPAGGGLCRDAQTCDTEATAGRKGQTTVTATLRCRTTGKTTKGTAPLTTTRIRLKEVSYSGASYHPVFEDKLGAPAYDPPQWQDNSSTPDGDADDAGDRKYPVSYKRKSTLRLSVTLRMDPAVTPAEPVKVRGDGPGDLDVEATVATVSGADIKIFNAPTKGTLAERIALINPLRIDWEVSMDDGKTWAKVGTSENRLYATFDNPKTPILYETLLDIGCRNANGLDTEAAAVAAIWSDFAGPLPGVKRKPIDGHNQSDGQEMHYWANEGDPRLPQIQAQCQLMEAMLNPSPASSTVKDIGTCLAWSQLFHETLRAQGIAGSQINEVKPSYPNAEMLVKNWSFAGTASAPASCSPFIYLYSEATDQTGAAGQGTTNPPGSFGNHFIVLYDKAYYDPSYGNGPFTGATLFDAQLAWENASLSGFARPCTSTVMVAKPKTVIRLESIFTPR